MGKELTCHFAVNENIHRATKITALERNLEINELVESILLTDNTIKKTYDRITGGT